MVSADYLCPDEAESIDIEVWQCNWAAVQVFQLCQPELVGGMGIWWHGIKAVEIEAASRLLRIPSRDREEIAQDVRYMGAVVAEYRNAEQARRAKAS